MSEWDDFKEGFKLFGENVAVLVNSILLTIVYIIGVGLTSIFAKIAGKSFMQNKKKKSYWQDLHLTKKPFDEYYRQF